uniref:hypothetical protein n=1 Tax=Chamaesiphon sp. OTE_20_metabat_361 TaxID=2964689 RepID=UPI00286B603C
MNISKTLGRYEHLWRKDNAIYLAFGWAALSLFTYVFFSGPAGGDRPFWYRIFTAYILQNVPTLVAGLLCLRNGLSRRMPSGSQVWLFIGIALLSYFTGNIFFSSWELVWHLNSTGSLGDPFFVIFYICLSIGMLGMLVSKQVRLNIYQWSLVAGISTYAAVILMWVLKPPAPPVALSQTQAVATAAMAPEIQPAETPATPAPEPIVTFDRLLKPYGQKLNLFYVWSDVFLFALAIVMTLAFWGGRLSSAWQTNALAIVCYYIADMWLAYAGNHIQDYQGG